VLAVPLLREGTAVGGLVIRRTDMRPFTDKQIALLKTFADQAVIAIENVRLFTELQARNQELTDALDRQTATAEILQVISRSQTDVRPVFETIADSAMRLFRAWSVVVCRYDGEQLHLEAASGGRPSSADEIRDQFPLRPGPGSAIGASILTRAVHHVGDAQASDQDPRLREAARARGFRSAVAAPMLRDGEPAGALVVTRAEARPFSEAEIELLRTFAAQAVIAIENVRLVSALQERNRALSEALEQQTATSEILRVISSSPTDTQPVFDAIVGNAVRLCGALYCVVWRYAGGLAHVASTHDIPPDQLDVMRRTYPRPIQDDPIHTRVTAGRTLEIPDIDRIPDPPTQALPDTRDRWRARGVRSVVVVPMRRDVEVVGAIGVTHRDAGAFSPRRVELLKTFADQAVIAIENARLFGELQERTHELGRSVDQLRALSEVGQAVSSTLDLDAVLQAIVTRASQLAGSRGCSIWEYDEQAEVFHLRATTILDAEIAAILRSAGLGKGVGAIGRAALTRAPVEIPDVSAAGAYEGPLREALIRAGGGSVLTIPLLHEDRILGGLTVSRRATGEFPPELVALLTAFAAQSAIALQNARLFRELEAKSRELEIASRHKSQFLANMSHELRTPLNAILGYGEMLADGIYGELPPPARDVLGRVDASGRHLLGLINDVLDLSKIEAGQLSLALAEYSMQEVAQTVIVSVEALAAEKGLALGLDMAPDLPAGRGDQRRLTQVLLNLVGNAIKFTEQGGVGVRVAVADGAFEIAVRDTGPGIAPADHERIFEEFQQADTATTRPKGGTGLGLAIARRIVALHGGRLWVESTLGEGATFRITVPIRVERQMALVEGAAS
jgi:signal transduction histidine kinase